MPGPAFLRGESVSLHTWEEEDIEFFRENRNRREIRRPLTDVSPRNHEQVEEQFEERLYEDDGMTFLVCTGDEQAMRTGDAEELTRVGEVAIPWVNQPHGVGMLMYWAAPEHQGEGYTETFRRPQKTGPGRLPDVQDTRYDRRVLLA